MISASFSYFDMTVIGIMLISCMFAFFRGFVKEILSLGAWIAAGLITLYYFPAVAEKLQPHFKNAIVAAGFATLGLYVLSLLVFSMINALILRFLKEGSDVGVLDNALGLLFGAFRGAFIVSLGYLLLTMVMGEEENYPKWLKEAQTRPIVEAGAKVLYKAAPDYMQKLSNLTVEGKEQAEEYKKTGNFKDSRVKMHEPEESDGSSSSSGGDSKMQEFLDKFEK